MDQIGTRNLATNMKALALESRLVIIGVMGGTKAGLNHLAPMMMKYQRIMGSELRSRPMERKAKITATFNDSVVPMPA